MGKKCEFISDGQYKAVAFLASKVAGLTKAKADILIKSGEVKVNGVRIRTNVSIAQGDRVGVFVPDVAMSDAPEIKVVYDDDNIVVFDKPKRLSYDGIAEYYGQKIYAVHRLDTNTSGLIVFAKAEWAQKQLESAFRDRRVKKVYNAVVYPSPEKSHDVLTAYMKLMPSKNYVLVSQTEKPGYKTMITEYEILKKVGGCALLKVTLHTGRTHQIRAHFCAIGCPIVGEHKYGIKGVSPKNAPDTQMLAAVEITFDGLEGKLSYLNGMTFKTDNGFDMSLFE